MKLEKSIALLEKYTGKKVVLETYGDTNEAIYELMAAMSPDDLEKVKLITNDNSIGILGQVQNATEIVSKYNQFYKTKLGLGKLVSNLLRILKHRNKGGTLYEHDDHECHCGGSCCTDKAQLNEGVFDLSTFRNAGLVSKVVGTRVQFDDYDANNRPIFLSPREKYEDYEWTVDEKGNVWRHDGFNDVKVGNVLKTAALIRENYRDTKENLALLKAAIKKDPMSRKGKKAAQILKKYELNTWDKEDYDNADSFLDETVEQWLDTYSNSMGRYTTRGLREGAWALPKTEEDRKLAIKTLEAWKKKFYHIVGTDAVFNGIDSAINEIQRLPLQQNEDYIDGSMMTK